ncbi:thiosulfate dehydrogenase [quinone] large subunit [Micromonospora viridifaciens]|uniref:Thiosulfate dehydrogenase [quinone] large subunit n=2 Tax=Micromonospora viridifaciens TaxID=1881 RepID=A0A1C4YN43_MICVI|nr:DoxX family membrane protein [Micromonospora viridifaciens]SCF22100.1 thiosulfate dehydrogenase [quinone] large subunit [Micromonospora viridifaciens]
MTATIERITANTIAPAVQTIRDAETTREAETARQRAARYVFAGLRIALGWIFLWAFLDKLFGLGHETAAKNAWINGGSPTKGFLAFGAKGPFEGFYHGIAGAAWADWLFMTGLAALGVALVLGIGMRVAAVAGGVLLVMMWTAVLPPANNPIVDDHLVYAGLLAGLALVGAGNTLGLGRAWAKLPVVQRLPWLQ